VRVDEPRIEYQATCVDDLVRLHRAKLADGGDYAVFHQHIRTAQNRIVVVTGDDAARVL